MPASRGWHALYLLCGEVEHRVNSGAAGDFRVGLRVSPPRGAPACWPGHRALTSPAADGLREDDVGLPSQAGRFCLVRPPVNAVAGVVAGMLAAQAIRDGCLNRKPAGGRE